MDAHDLFLFANGQHPLTQDEQEEYDNPPASSSPVWWRDLSTYCDRVQENNNEFFWRLEDVLDCFKLANPTLQGAQLESAIYAPNGHCMTRAKEIREWLEQANKDALKEFREDFGIVGENPLPFETDQSKKATTKLEAAGLLVAKTNHTTQKYISKSMFFGGNQGTDAFLDIENGDSSRRKLWFGLDTKFQMDFYGKVWHPIRNKEV